MSDGGKADLVEALHAHCTHAEQYLMSGTLCDKDLWGTISPVVKSLKKALDVSSEAVDRWLFRDRIYGEGSQEVSVEVEGRGLQLCRRLVCHF